MTRAETVAAFEAFGVKLDHALAFHTDDALERLLHFWRQHGARPNVVVGIDSAGESLAFWIADHDPPPQSSNEPPKGYVDVSSLF